MQESLSVQKQIILRDLNKHCRYFRLPFELDDQTACDFSEEDLFLYFWDVWIFTQEGLKNSQLYRMWAEKMQEVLLDGV